ncbi:hypothetical protein DdX_11227 [Ditylenchus destructor]|uniref:Uncharacterized protein n=1 Tax=Ditylenchus destructor TaxID=166010 RepID=A0AAD4N0E2_9BILA|nr:hypothetical protein DdX_11227 [Ditylenchus destructor]
MLRSEHLSTSGLNASGRTDGHWLLSKAPTQSAMFVSNKARVNASVSLEMPDLYSKNISTPPAIELFDNSRATTQSIISAPINGFPVSCETQNLAEANGMEVSAPLKMKISLKHGMCSSMTDGSAGLIPVIGTHNNAITGNISNRSIRNAPANIYDFEPEDEQSRRRQTAGQPNRPPAKYYFSEAFKLRKLKPPTSEYALFSLLCRQALVNDLKLLRQSDPDKCFMSYFK